MYLCRLTELGELKLAQALSSGAAIDVVEMCLGDANGQYYAPDGTEVALVNEHTRLPITTALADHVDGGGQVLVELVLAPDVGPLTVREAGLVDSDGELIAIANFSETTKSSDANGMLDELSIQLALVISATQSMAINFVSNKVASKAEVDLLKSQLNELNAWHAYQSREDNWSLQFSREQSAKRLRIVYSGTCDSFRVSSQPPIYLLVKAGQNSMTLIGQVDGSNEEETYFPLISPSHTLTTGQSGRFWGVIEFDIDAMCAHFQTTVILNDDSLFRSNGNISVALVYGRFYEQYKLFSQAYVCVQANNGQVSGQSYTLKELNL